jgi:hypothetical protein
LTVDEWQLERVGSWGLQAQCFHFTAAFDFTAAADSEINGKKLIFAVEADAGSQMPEHGNAFVMGLPDFVGIAGNRQ